MALIDSVVKAKGLIYRSNSLVPIRVAVLKEGKQFPNPQNSREYRSRRMKQRPLFGTLASVRLAVVVSTRSRIFRGRVHVRTLGNAAAE